MFKHVFLKLLLKGKRKKKKNKAAMNKNSWGMKCNQQTEHGYAGFAESGLILQADSQRYLSHCGNKKHFLGFFLRNQWIPSWVRVDGILSGLFNRFLLTNERSISISVLQHCPAEARRIQKTGMNGGGFGVVPSHLCSVSQSPPLEIPFAWWKRGSKNKTITDGAGSTIHQTRDNLPRSSRKINEWNLNLNRLITIRGINNNHQNR